MNRDEPPLEPLAGSDEQTHLEEIVTDYLDRLNAGEKIDPLEVVNRYPEFGGKILEELYSFVDLYSESDRAPVRTLGDYTLRRQIGRGGMGVVYEAWENSMDRAVALKVLPAGIAADEKACTRFMREAQTAGKLSHANVVGVYSTGVRQGTPWYSMELVDGETLAQITARWTDAHEQSETPFGKRGELAFYSNLARAFADVADGLQHAHTRGVVHRDIKPSNLILDSCGQLRILDFGLARLEGQESLTLSGDLMGTVLYMSPEQAMAKRIPLDHRTDIYSLGATLYEMVTGRPPFRGKNQHETLSQIVVRDPLAPRQLSSGVPKDLETIVLKCLRKDAAERYGTAEALAQDLRRFVRGDPIEARPQSPWERMATRLKRQRTTLAVVAVFLALVGVAGWMAYRRVQAEQRFEAVTREVQQARYETAVRELRKRIYAHQYSLQVVEGEVPDLFFRPTGRSRARLTPEEVQEIREDSGTHPVAEAVLELSRIAGVFPKPDAEVFPTTSWTKPDEFPPPRDPTRPWSTVHARP